MTTSSSQGGLPRNPLSLARFLIHLPNFIKLYWRLFTDRRVPLLPKIILVLGIAYVLVPTDLLPDLLAPLGLLDDAAVMIIAAKGFIALCPRRIVDEHVQLIDKGG